MFVRLTRIEVKIDRIDEGIKLYEESVIPEAKKQRGFKDIFLLVDRKTGKGISFGFWESEEDAIASEKNRYYQEQVIKALHLYTGMPVREGYEVVLKA